MRGKIWDVDEDTFRNYVKDSFNYSEIVRKCGLTHLSSIEGIKNRISDTFVKAQLLLMRKKENNDSIFVVDSAK